MKTQWIAVVALGLALAGCGTATGSVPAPGARVPQGGAQASFSRSWFLTEAVAKASDGGCMRGETIRLVGQAHMRKTVPLRVTITASRGEDDTRCAGMDRLDVRVELAGEPVEMTNAELARMLEIASLSRAVDAALIERAVGRLEAFRPSVR